MYKNHILASVNIINKELNNKLECCKISPQNRKVCKMVYIQESRDRYIMLNVVGAQWQNVAAGYGG